MSTNRCEVCNKVLRGEKEHENWCHKMPMWQFDTIGREQLIANAVTEHTRMIEASNAVGRNLLKVIEITARNT